VSAVAQLRAATWSSHQRLEKRLNVKARFTEVGAYRSHLEKLWGFIAGLEQALSAESFGSALPDYDARRKLPLLTQDLIALGTDERSVYLLPRCPLASARLDPAAAFGCAYVLEGATLGGRTLLPLVAERLGFSADHGAAFLASYGAKIPAMWHKFCDALDAWCCLPERRTSASEAAVATFDSLTEWLCGTPS
jgi:heme oxygenase